MIGTLALFLMGCNPQERTPENDSHWNPEDLMDGLEQKGAKIDFDPDDDYDGDFENTYSFDASDIGLSNDDITLTDAEFYNAQDIRCTIYHEEDGDSYQECEINKASAMSFGFYANTTGEYCEASIERRTSLFADNTDWTFRYQDENPYCLTNTKDPNCLDDFSCDGELRVDDAIEGINWLINSN